jgi:hypothetical protein
MAAVSRYRRAPVLGFGSQLGTSKSIAIIRNAIKTGTLSFTTTTLRGVERLDTMAGALWGDGRYWWVLAASSDIGWGLQVPPGTVIRVPNLTDVLRLIG